MAWRTSLASALPSFQAVLPATLPAFGATRAPALAPFLFPTIQLPPSLAEHVSLKFSYPEQTVRKQRCCTRISVPSTGSSRHEHPVPPAGPAFGATPPDGAWVR